MPNAPLRALLPGFVLLAGCALTFGGTREQHPVQLVGSLASVLQDVPDYRIQNQVVGDEERRVAGMSDYVARIYWRDTTPAFTTYIGYYDQQTQGKSIHSPRNCLPGAGWEILRSGTATVHAADGPHVVNHYLLKNGGLQAVVYYWYQGRGRVVANEYAVKLNLLRDAALLGHTEEALVRIVLPIDPRLGDEAAQLAKADSLGTQMATRLIDEVGRVLPSSSPARRVAVIARESGR
jgi:EpsI family protein